MMNPGPRAAGLEPPRLESATPRHAAKVNVVACGPCGDRCAPYRTAPAPRPGAEAWRHAALCNVATLAYFHCSSRALLSESNVSERGNAVTYVVFLVPSAMLGQAQAGTAYPSGAALRPTHRGVAASRSAASRTARASAGPPT